MILSSVSRYIIPSTSCQIPPICIRKKIFKVFWILGAVVKWIIRIQDQCCFINLTNNLLPIQSLWIQIIVLAASHSFKITLQLFYIFATKLRPIFKYASTTNARKPIEIKFTEAPFLSNNTGNLVWHAQYLAIHVSVNYFHIPTYWFPKMSSKSLYFTEVNSLPLSK